MESGDQTLVMGMLRASVWEGTHAPKPRVGSGAMGLCMPLSQTPLDWRVVHHWLGTMGTACRTSSLGRVVESVWVPVGRCQHCAIQVYSRQGRKGATERGVAVGVREGLMGRQHGL